MVRESGGAFRVGNREYKSGDRYGRLTILGPGSRSILVRAVCDCGAVCERYARRISRKSSACDSCKSAMSKAKRSSDEYRMRRRKGTAKMIWERLRSRGDLTGEWATDRDLFVKWYSSSFGKIYKRDYSQPHSPENSVLSESICNSSPFAVEDAAKMLVENRTSKTMASAMKRLSGVSRQRVHQLAKTYRKRHRSGSEVAS